MQMKTGSCKNCNNRKPESFTDLYTFQTTCFLLKITCNKSKFGWKLSRLNTRCNQFSMKISATTEEHLVSVMSTRTMAEQKRCTGVRPEGAHLLKLIIY